MSCLQACLAQKAAGGKSGMVGDGSATGQRCVPLEGSSDPQNSEYFEGWMERSWCAQAWSTSAWSRPPSCIAAPRGGAAHQRPALLPFKLNQPACRTHHTHPRGAREKSRSCTEERTRTAASGPGCPWARTPPSHARFSRPHHRSHSCTHIMGTNSALRCKFGEVRGRSWRSHRLFQL